MRLMRLLIIVLVIMIPLLAGGMIYLWFVGGKTLDQSVVIVASKPPLTQPAGGGRSTLNYQLEDLTVHQTDTGVETSALVDYSRAVKAILSAYNNQAIENELALVVLAAQTDDPTISVKIADISARHTEAALQLKALTVPPSVAQVHLNLMNSLLGLAEVSYLMSTIKETPVVALESAQYIYPERLKKFFTAMNNLNLFLLASGVVVPEAERSIISLGL